MGRKPKAKQFAREGGPIRERIREPISISIREEQELEAETFRYVPFEATNPLHIDPEILKSIRDDYGYHLQWVAESVLGQPQEQTVAARRRNGYADVQRGNFGSILDHMTDRDGVVRKNGLVLMARPYQIEELARAYEKKQAKKAIADMKRKHAEEGVDVPMPGGGKHKSALAQNRHRTEMARIEIPEE